MRYMLLHAVALNPSRFPTEMISTLLVVLKNTMAFKQGYFLTNFLLREAAAVLGPEGRLSNHPDCIG